MSRRLCHWLPCLFSLLVTVGCARSDEGIVRAPIGRPQRIISLAPSVTEVLFALGAGPQMAACTRLCNYPPEVRRLPRIGDMHIDLEAVVGLAPDLIVAESITPDEVVRRLQALGLYVLRVDSSTLEAYLTTLTVLGKATGHRDEARRLTEQLTQRVYALRRSSQHLTLRARPRVFVEIWDHPLQTAGGGTFIDQMITLAGGTNIFHDVEQYPRINAEALVTRDPEVVLLTTSQVDAFTSFEPFRACSAVRQGRVYVFAPDTLVRPSPRLVDALDELVRDLRR